MFKSEITSVSTQDILSHLTSAVIQSSADPLTFLRPAYDVQKASLLPPIQDRILALLAPILAYWISSLFFHIIDSSDPSFLRRYRIHEPEQITKRNKVSPKEVLKAVIGQQIVQTALGLVVMESQQSATNEVFRNDTQKMIKLIKPLIIVSRAVLGPRVALSFLTSSYALPTVRFIYWWAIPALQFVIAMLVMDSWQYWLHRWAHTNKWLYRKFHSVHHRLYVPYAYGALYNHPVEGFFLDSLGAFVSQLVAGLSTRQSIAFFAFASLKTCNDHASHRLPWNPLNIFPNDAVFHNYHHQNEYIKYNFSQPFFIHMDRWFGTMLTEDEIRKREDKKVERKKDL